MHSKRRLFGCLVSFPRGSMQRNIKSRDTWRPTIKRRLKCIIYKTNEKYYKILTIYECLKKKSMIMGCNRSSQTCHSVNGWYLEITYFQFLNKEGLRLYMVYCMHYYNRLHDIIHGVLHALL